MFRSLECDSYIYATNECKYKLTDSEFVVNVVDNLGHGGCVSIAKEYARRNLPVAKNMALLCLYLEALGLRRKMKDINQDKFCSKHIDNWSGIAAERDRLLGKLSAMK